MPRSAMNWGWRGQKRGLAAPHRRGPRAASAGGVRRACIDVGSNTTRLLVAECEAGQLTELHQERAFTRIGRGLRRDGAIL